MESTIEATSIFHKREEDKATDRRLRNALTSSWYQPLPGRLAVLRCWSGRLPGVCRRSDRALQQRAVDGTLELLALEMGEQNKRDDILRTMAGQRGSANTIYVNRTFFGL